MAILLYHEKGVASMTTLDGGFTMTGGLSLGMHQPGDDKPVFAALFQNGNPVVWGVSRDLRIVGGSASHGYDYKVEIIPPPISLN